MLERVWRKGNPLTLLVGMQIGIASMENSMEIPLKIPLLQRTSIDISPKRTHVCQKAHETMLNIANYERNANQNYNEVSPRSGQNGLTVWRLF